MPVLFIPRRMRKPVGRKPLISKCRWLTNRYSTDRFPESRHCRVPVISSNAYPPKTLRLTSTSPNTEASTKSESLCAQDLSRKTSRQREGLVVGGLLVTIWGSALLGLGIFIGVWSYWKYVSTTITGASLFAFGILLLMIPLRVRQPMLATIQVQMICLCFVLLGLGFEIHQLVQTINYDFRDRFSIYDRMIIKVLRGIVVIRAFAIVNILADLTINIHVYKKQSFGHTRVSPHSSSQTPVNVHHVSNTNEIF